MNVDSLSRQLHFPRAVFAPVGSSWDAKQESRDFHSRSTVECSIKKNCRLVSSPTLIIILKYTYGKNLTGVFNKKTAGKPAFLRVCLQSENFFILLFSNNFELHPEAWHISLFPIQNPLSQAF